MDDERATAVEGTPRRARTEVRALERGTQIGRYVVIDRLGAGGMGIVYAAYDPDLNRRVAIKLVYARADDDADVQGRMLREAQALARLSHPNVVAVFDVGTAEDRVFLAMELVEGETLSAWYGNAQRTWREIVAKFAEAGRGLAAAHAAGIVHRDFKPNNVLVGNDGRARVLDFGLARAAGEQLERADNVDSPSARDVLSEDLTRTGSVLGTPVYMPPEAQRGEPVSAAGDQFSFCVALYEALYGTRPFHALITSDGLPPIEPAPADTRVPIWLRRVVVRGLEFEPGQRYPSMDALLAALADDPAIRRRKLMRGAGAVVVAAAVVAGGLAWRAHVRAERLAADPCETSEPFADAWSTGERERLRAAFVATGEPTAEDELARTAAGLDDMARDWLDARARACRDTRETHAKPEATLVLRLACLDRVKADVGALVALLGHADAATVKVASHAIRRIQGPVECDDPQGLAVVATPPPAIAPAVEALRVRLFHVRALSDVQDLGTASHEIDGVLADAQRLGYQPAISDALLERCLVLNSATQPGAADACERAELAGLAAGLDGNAARAAASRFEIAAATGEPTETVSRLRERARVWLERTHARSPHAVYEGALAISETNAGHYEAALEHLRRTHELADQLYGPAGDFVIQIDSSQSVALTVLGRFAEAAALQERDVVAVEHAYGTHNDLYASLLDNYGYSLAVVGRHADARRALERSLAIREAEDFTRAAAQCDLARVDNAEARFDRAIAGCEQGIAKLRELGQRKFNLAINMDPLANGYLGAHRYDDALRLSRECLAEFRRDRKESDHDTIEMVSCLVIEGTALVELGR
ncbi:MAG TPA: serine/threonine-protein kinase, partial [Kofleriaceae bacterium]|nr:serine/threonine-protein kinase [Kofleriaceae bacterium]